MSRWFPIGIAVSLHLSGAGVFASPAAAPAAGAEMNSITVEVQKQRDALRREADTFVSAVAVQPWNSSLARWNIPICPLVAGLTQDEGEYILRRLSQIASTVGAPLAPERCRPNYYVVATDDPDALLAAWRRRDKTMFGIDPEPKIQRFLHSANAVRVWYNADINAADGMPQGDVGLSLYAVQPSSTGTGFNGVPTNLHAKLSRLQWDELRDLASVIIIVDKRRVGGIALGQLADFVALAGLTEVRLDAPVAGNASILRMFDRAVAQPAGLTPWDQAFLEALYHTDQSDKLQGSVIATQIALKLAPKP
jgi:hypothetical protein